MTPVMVRRIGAAQACIDRFNGKPYHAANRHCGKLAAHALMKMGRSAKLLTASRHTTEAGAIRYLRQTGFADLVALMDAMGLERIAPAAALPGDIVGLPSGDAFGCSLSVAVGEGLVLGLVEGADFQILIPHDFVAAWRV